MNDTGKRKDDKYLVPAVEQAARLLFSLAGHNASHMSLLEICAQVGIHKSKAYSILHTLQKFGLIQKNDDRKGYSLGPGLITLSRKVLDDFNAPRLAEPILAELARRFECTATLGLIADRKVFVVAKHEGGLDLGVTIRVGHRFPLSYGSHGKAIAAALLQEELDLLLQEPDLYFHGAPEQLDRDRLRDELDHARREGFGLDLGEMKQGIRSVAAAVFGPGRLPLGYIALIGLFPDDTARASGPIVAQAAKTLSRQLGAHIE